MYDTWQSFIIVIGFVVVGLVIGSIILVIQISGVNERLVNLEERHLNLAKRFVSLTQALEKGKIINHFWCIDDYYSSEFDAREVQLIKEYLGIYRVKEMKKIDKMVKR